MRYEPIKKGLGLVFNKNPYLRILFYKLLDLLLLRAWHIKSEIRKTKKELGENASVLDAGSGFGQYTFFMASLSKSWKITGVDIMPEQREDCNAFFSKIGMNNRVKFELADLTKFKVDSQYNLIISVDVMEHILEDIEVFKNFHQALKSGGIALISTPSDQGGSDVHDHDKESFIAEHVREGYNIEEIKMKLSHSGFSKTEARYTYGKPGQISWKLSMKYPITMLNTSKLFFIILPFYYLVTYPFCIMLNYWDLYGKHKTGTGLIVKAWK
jgi:cyclopropane fatty-acyl-phospholipid synthase-like methyltransferase